MDAKISKLIQETIRYGREKEVILELAKTLKSDDVGIVINDLQHNLTRHQFNAQLRLKTLTGGTTTFTNFYYVDVVPTVKDVLLEFVSRNTKYKDLLGPDNVRSIAYFLDIVSEGGEISEEYIPKPKENIILVSKNQI